MKKAFRIGYWRYIDDLEFKVHLDFVKKYKDCIDEIALFTEFSHHAYYHLEDIRELALILARRIEAYRKIGIKSVGLNVLDTIGQTNEAWDVLSKSPFQTMIGHNGESSTGCLCPNTKEFKEYTREKYLILAQTQPDFIWIDDDIRMDNHGVDYPCFCETCLNIFNERHKCNYTRESLTKELNSKEGKKVRKNWVEHNNLTILQLLGMLEKVIHNVNPSIITGFMTCGQEWHAYSIFNYKDMMGTLKAEKGRPGGGFYNDEAPIWLMSKLLSCGRQAAGYPAKVKDIQYEFEDFPYQKLSKSLCLSRLECAASLMNGCNSIAFNALFFTDYPELLECIKENAAGWDSIVQIGEAYKNIGLYPLYNELYDTRRKIENRNFFGGGNIDEMSKSADNLCEIGVPIAHHADDACGFVLSGQMAEGFTDDELKSILTKGVLMDGHSLQVLLERGLGEYCGVKISKKIDNGVCEIFTEHELNGTAAGYKRDIFVTFWDRDDSRRRTSYAFEKTVDKVQVISNLHTITGQNLGPTFVIYENPYGGRIAISGHVAFRFLYSGEKRMQMLKVCDWISNGTLPVRIDKCIKVAPFIKKMDTTGQMLIMLANCNFDHTGEIDVVIRTNKMHEVYEIDKAGKRIRIDNIDVSNEKNEIMIHLSDISPWGYKIIELS